jgi:transglutaminase-like putative cysteine protease
MNVRYQITHRTTYTYEQPVVLNPHTLRLRPQSNGFQHLCSFTLELKPEPKGLGHILDAEGNTVTRCWWDTTETTVLNITSTSTVETFLENPFLYQLEPWAMRLPFDYPTSLQHALKSHLSPHPLLPHTSITHQLAQELVDGVNWNPLEFLRVLNFEINKQCRYELRESGDPQPPDLTWSRKTGTCRDFVLLFMAACRAVGIATRFVSGYEEGDPSSEKFLHAWAEVYLPGAGWRGYDPTLGQAVSNRHIAIAASGWPKRTAPVEGTHRGNLGGQEGMNTQITLERISDEE